MKTAEATFNTPELSEAEKRAEEKKRAEKEKRLQRVELEVETSSGVKALTFFLSIGAKILPESILNKFNSGFEDYKSRKIGKAKNHELFNISLAEYVKTSRETDSY